MMNDSKRPKLLPDAEINDIYARPVFNKKERELYFDLSKEEMTVLDQFTNKRTRVYFILQLGYFKAKQQFFSGSRRKILMRFFSRAKIQRQSSLLAGYPSKMRGEYF